MTQITHIAVTTAGALALRLSGNDLVWAYLFGVLIDADHIIKYPLYKRKLQWTKRQYFHWRTPLQEPVSFLWLIPFSIWISSWVPIIFFSLHLVLDYLTTYEKRPWFPFHRYATLGLFPRVSNTLKEGMVLAASLLFIGVLIVRGYV